MNPAAIPSYEGVEVCPGAAGGKQWTGMAYSPMTRWATCRRLRTAPRSSTTASRAKAKGLPAGPDGFRYLAGQAYGKVMAIDPANGQAKWEVKTRSPMSASMLATAGGLVFTGDAEGNVVAYDDRTGDAAVVVSDRLRHPKRPRGVHGRRRRVHRRRVRTGRRGRRLHGAWARRGSATTAAAAPCSSSGSSSRTPRRRFTEARERRDKVNDAPRGS